MPSPTSTFLEGVPAASHKAHSVIFTCSSPKRFCESETCPGANLPFAWPLRRNVFFFVGSMTVHLGRVSIASLANNLCKMIPCCSHTHTVGPFHPWRVSSSTYAPAFIDLSPPISWVLLVQVLKKHNTTQHNQTLKPRFARREDFHPSQNWVVILHFFLPLQYLLCPHTSVLGFRQQLRSDNRAVGRINPPTHSHIFLLPPISPH